MDIDEAAIEQLARRIHERDRPALGWHDLGEQQRGAVRAEAWAVVERLAAIGLTMVPGSAAQPFTAHELERVAAAEHQRWVEDRERAGWTYGAVRDDVAKKHPMLLGWAVLPESERIRDRNSARLITDLLTGAGLTPRRD